MTSWILGTINQCFPRLCCILVWFSVAAPRAKIVNLQHLVLGFIFVSEFEFVFVVLVFGLL